MNLDIYDDGAVVGTLTTDHPASRYGCGTLTLDGDDDGAYGPGDVVVVSGRRVLAADLVRASIAVTGSHRLADRWLSQLPAWAIPGIRGL
jgi:hypothetical protein